MSTTGHIYDDANMGSSQGSVEGPQGTGGRPITPVDLRLHVAAASGTVDPLTAALTAGSTQRSFSPVGTTVVVPGQHADASGSEITVSGAVSRDEAQAAFSVVQGAFSEMTSEHEKIKSGLQALASHVGAMHAEQAGELANVVHGAQEALQHSSLIKTELESRLQTSEIQQAHAKEVAELARRRSEEALLQSEGTK